MGETAAHAATAQRASEALAKTAVRQATSGCLKGDFATFGKRSYFRMSCSQQVGKALATRSSVAFATYVVHMKRWMIHAAMPLLAVVLFAAWWARERDALLLNAVPMREDTFTTSPYAVLAVAAFALALALSRVRPSWSLGLIGLALLSQLLFWPMRLGQTSWTAYLILVPAVFVISRSARTARTRHFAAVTASALAVAALLSIPALSFKGTEGTITGKPWPSAEAFQGLAICVVACAVIALAAWAAGRPRERREPAHAAEDSQPNDPGFESLSPRERDVFRLVARGLSNADVAKEVFVSETTVKTHVGSILSKLGLSSRNELIVYAYERRIVRPAALQV